MSFQYELIHQMEMAGIYFDGQIDWSSKDVQRLKEQSKRGKNIWLYLHPGGASFGNWRTDVNVTWWEKPWRSLSQNERSTRMESLRSCDQAKAKQKSIKTTRALLKAKAIFSHPKCKEASLDHPYIIKKRIVPYYGYQLRSYILLPIHSISGDLISIQYIKSNFYHTKKFKSHLPIKGGFIFLGENIDPEKDILWICEGWATGCSIYEAVGKHVICALMASNIETVAYQFRKSYPKIRMVICADNDAHLSHNIGLISAKKTASLISATLKVPPIPGDWNDVLCTYGLEYVTNELYKDVI